MHNRLDADGLRAMWAAKLVVRNAWLTLPDAYLAETVAASGCAEAVTLDMQHGLFDRRSAVECIRAILMHGAAPFARLSGLDEALIGFLLDAGAVGLILPMTEDASYAARFVAACRYPPLGIRSHGPTRAGLLSQAFPGNGPVRFAMIETVPGVEAAESIAAVSGLDGLFVGPGDLGISLGIGPGQDRVEPDFLNALKHIERATYGAGKLLGIHANSAGYASRMAMIGYKFVTVWVDAVAIRASLAASKVSWIDGISTADDAKRSP